MNNSFKKKIIMKHRIFNRMQQQTKIYKINCKIKTRAIKKDLFLTAQINIK